MLAAVAPTDGAALVAAGAGTWIAATGAGAAVTTEEDARGATASSCVAHGDWRRCC